MKRIIKYFFDNWFIPIVISLFVTFLILLSSKINLRFLKTVISYASDFSAALLIFSFFYQIIYGRYLRGMITIFVFIATGIFYMMTTLVDGDHWADYLEIPTGIQIESPIHLNGNYRPDSILKLHKKQADLVLYYSDQPGKYEYDFWTGKIEKGIIYLKAFEITQDERLSSDELKQASTIYISNQTDSIIRFGSKNNFTIYEGDWGKFYAARFEVWFKPTAGDERKLYQKNFKVEGWMH